MTFDADSMNRRLSALEAESKYIAEQIRGAEEQLAGERRALSEWERARDLVVEVLIATQGQAKGFIEEVVSLALSSTYGPDYGFALDYERKRNQMEATPWIVVGGERFSPRDEVGGGVIDVAAMAMRLALWSLMEPRPAATFLLDEPTKFLSADLQPAFGKMLSELAGSLGAQFVLVTHSPAVAEYAEMAYEVSNEDGVSLVCRIEQGERA